MDAVLQGIISDAARLCRATSAEYWNILTLDVQYTDHAAEITQEAIDSVPSFLAAGLMVADVANAVYALKMMKVQIDTVSIDSFIKVAKL